MQLSATLAWLVDAAGETPGPDRLLAELGARLLEDGLPLAGGALTLAVPHPLIARRTWLWRAENGEVIEAVGFAAGRPRRRRRQARRTTPVGAGSPESPPASCTTTLSGPDRTGPRSAGSGRVSSHLMRPIELRQVARFAAAPLAVLAARATLAATLEAYLGRRSAARVLAAPLRRDVGETIQAALLYADLRGFTALSESNPPALVLSALDAWFDRIAGAVHAFGGEVLKFIGDGVLAIFPVVGARRAARATRRCGRCPPLVSGWRISIRRDSEQGLPPLPFGAALHLGEMLWGNIGAADRLDFTAIGPAVNLVSRLEGLCRPLGRRSLSRARLPPRRKRR